MPDMARGEHRLLVVAHGTASTDGRATTEALVTAIAAARPGVGVGLCFLDVVEPSLPAALDALGPQPAVLVPLLLCTGYHVQTDIPAAVAHYPHVRVARHLGPHPLLIDVLLDRLGGMPAAGSLALVGAGSTRSQAYTELAETARLLAARVGRPVAVLTMADDLGASLRGLARPVNVAAFLLAEGQFVTSLGEAAAGVAAVSSPLGVHPALVSLVWTRYDEALDEVR